ncbi:MAG: hypothetical protein JHC93_08330 [Parachlamydiales bacterium]|nr:hypothetical protein [Parachlamydiales bacterium]
MKFFKRIVLAFSLFSQFVVAIENNVDIYGPLVDEITSSFTKDMLKNYDMTCDLAGGSMPYDVEILGYGFNGCKQLQIEEARSLIIKWSEDLIRKVNANEKIRPYLHNYPFTNKNINLAIDLEIVNGGTKYPVDPPYIAFIILTHGKIRYSVYDEENSFLNSFKGKTVLIETYEEAFKIESEKL